MGVLAQVLFLYLRCKGVKKKLHSQQNSNACIRYLCLLKVSFSLPKNLFMFWKTYDLNDGEAEHLSLGEALELRLERHHNEFRLQHRTPSAEAPPPAYSCARWVLQEAPKAAARRMSVSVMPALPDRPLIVRPEFPLHLMPGAEIYIFIRVPLFVSISHERPQKRALLTELPSFRLSNTWFGEITEGELCYWLKTHAHTVPETEEHKPHLCTCPIHIVNTSDEELPADKLCLRMDTLHIYELNGALWSDQMNIFYKGEDKFSDLDPAGKPPAQAPGARLLSPPRKSDSSNIAVRTFKALNQFQPFSVFS